MAALSTCLVTWGCSTGVSELSCHWDNERVYFQGTYVLDAWEEAGKRTVTIDCYAYDQNDNEVCHSETEIEASASLELTDAEEQFTCSCRISLPTPQGIYCQALSEDD